MPFGSQHLCFVGLGKSPSAPWLWAATTAAVSEREAALDPARPLQTLYLSGILPPPLAAQLDYTERNTALHHGVSTFTIGSQGVHLERLISSYKTNPSGVADASYLDVTTMRTLSHLRTSLRNRIATKYPRHKVANSGTQVGAGQAVVTPNLQPLKIL